jgi:hypothetical protein
MNPEQELSRAVSSEQILNNPLVSEAFVDIEKDVIDRIAICDVRDSVTREKLCLMLTSLRLFKSVFETHIQTGKMAAMTLEQKRNSLVLGGRKVF